MPVLKLINYKCANKKCNFIEEDDEKSCGLTKLCPVCGRIMEKMFQVPEIHCGVRKSIFHGPKAKGRYTKYIEKK